MPNMPVDIILIVLWAAIIWSAPLVLILGIIAMLLNKSDFDLKEKKRVLTIVGIILGFVLIENVLGFSERFLESLGYLLAIPISIFNFKIESSN